MLRDGHVKICYRLPRLSVVVASRNGVERPAVVAYRLWQQLEGIGHVGLDVVVAYVGKEALAGGILYIRLVSEVLYNLFHALETVCAEALHDLCGGTARPVRRHCTTCTASL